MACGRIPRAGRLAASGLLIGLCGAAGRAAKVPGVSRQMSPRVLPARPAEKRNAPPLVFEKNLGQLRGRGSEHVKFFARGQGYTLYLTATGVVLRLNGIQSGIRSWKPDGRLPVVSRRLQSAADLGGRTRDNPPRPMGQRRTTPGIVGLNLLRANPSAKVVGVDELPGKANYLIGNDPRKWRTDVPTYARIKYQDVYPGIDLVFDGNRGSLEFDLIARPGADPNNVVLCAEYGNSKVEIAKSSIESSQSNPQNASNGDVIIRTPGGEIRLGKPTIYQLTADNGPRTTDDILHSAYKTHHSRLIPGRYVLSANQRIRIEIHHYNRSEPLIIDPVLSYSTYLGGSGFDYASAVAVDSAGNAYLTGQTDSLDFPTSNPEQNSSGGGTCGTTLDVYPCFDAFVTKVSASGSSIVYSTYLGGSGDDRGTGIALDASGNAYVTGYTTSTDFPVLNAAQAENAGGNCGSATNPLPCYDAFVAKLNPAGAALVYATYWGGTGQDLASGIAVDAWGEATIAGSTSSPDFPVTAGAAQATYGGGNSDAFAVRLDAAVSKAVYSTYLGGSGEDRGLGIALDSAGNAFLTGSTASSDFPEVHALQPAIAGGTCGSSASPVPCTDAFVTELDPSGASLLYSTYLGGSGGDAGNAIAVDSSGAASVAGMTASPDFPVTLGAFQQTGGGTSVDAFVTKLAPDGSERIYSTYLGGSGAATAYGIAVDAAGQAYVTGYSNDGTFPVASPVQGSPGGFYDAFVSKLNAAGSALIFSSFLGGSGDETGQGIAVDGAGNIVIAGGTFSVNFPTVSALQPSSGGGSYDAWVARIRGTQLPVLTVSKSSVVFPGQGVGTSSEPIPVALANNGDAPLAISSVTASGDYSETNNCGAAVPAGATCTVEITFSPTSLGPLTGSVTISDNAWGSAHVVPLAGNGIPSPVVELSPASLSFPMQLVGTTSAAETVTLSNTGSVTLNISAMATLGDFSQASNCMPSVLAAGSCQIHVTFGPLDAGGLAGQLTIEDDAPGSPHVVIMTGTGTGPAITLSPSALSFGNQKVGTTSAGERVTLTSSGTIALTISGIAASGDFAETNNCPASLAPGGRCAVNVSFAPKTQGALSGTLAITDDAAESPQQVPLSGAGVAPVATLSSGAVNFPDQGVGTTSSIQIVNLTNTGKANMNVWGLAASGDFAQTNNCGVSLAPAASCAIQIGFTPAALGSRSGTVTISDDAANNPQTVSLAGNGVVAFSLTSAPSEITVAAGTDSAAFSVSATSRYSYPGTVTLACGAGATVQCAFNPPGITAGETSTLTVSGLSTANSDFVTLDILGSSENQIAELPLSVLVQDFSLGTTDSSATVSAGQPVQFQLTLQAINGFNQPITIGCDGAPPQGACSINPIAWTADGSASASLSVTVTTTARPAAAPMLAPAPFSSYPVLLWSVLIFAAAIYLVAGLRPQRRLSLGGLVAMTLGIFIMLASGCGGGGQGGGATNPGTPAGSYSLHVTATSGKLARSVKLTLQVN